PSTRVSAFYPAVDLVIERAHEEATAIGESDGGNPATATRKNTVGAASGRRSLAAVLIREVDLRGCRSRTAIRASGSRGDRRWESRCSSSARLSCRHAPKTRARLAVA